LGQHHRLGLGVPPSPSEAETWLRRAAVRGHIKAMTALGDLFAGGASADLAAAGVHYREAAELGDGQAQFALAELYLHGLGVPLDSQEAARWFRSAALQDVVPAYERLGALYADGDGVEKDIVAARDWFERGAERAHGPALFALGVIEDLGLAGAPNATAAARWYRRAADAGVGEACLKLGLMYADGKLGFDQRALAVDWFRKGALLENLDAACNLGLLQVTGTFGPRDVAKGLRLLEETARAGSRAAALALAKIFRDGEYVEPDSRAAEHWLRIAPEAKCDVADDELAPQGPAVAEMNVSNSPRGPF
ncbi:MAG: hypothetical protein JWQ46_3089, partial [Phenylobacterium sp.]|nr:hypothetical protein [Phenylobacterium sp.]